MNENEYIYKEPSWHLNQHKRHPLFPKYPRMRASPIGVGQKKAVG